MKKALCIAGALLFSAAVHAQTEVAVSHRQPVETQSAQLSSTLVEPGYSESSRSLPDASKPIQPNPQPSPCPQGVGKPCASLGGRLYFPDILHMTEHDRSWGRAMSHPAMIVGTLLNVGAAAWDYQTTRYCIEHGAGREANPIMGQSRAQELAVGIGITAFSTWATGKLKENGDGNRAFFIQWTGTALHFLAAAHNRAVCSK
jgi:hypothetical protein